MQYLILYIETPNPGDFSYDSSQTWNSIENCLAKLCKRNKDTKKLGKSCWMIPLQGELPSIAEAVYLAKRAGFPYETLYFDKKDDWVSFP
ncbi:hypothetical protein SAMN05216326_12533 [Nitrosomonas marina]|uniref:Uncharacterized protein n=1 Tax=Nitrosomonas marina TaxID=917 RepID=A0A1I0E6B8_9PROT|nr:hypothetical protein [Nitrosomonas marina]SET40699.1 hypothetical protein SAMN05216326_12533 [Nitrosomonas marina]